MMMILWTEGCACAGQGSHTFRTNALNLCPFVYAISATKGTSADGTTTPIALDIWIYGDETQEEDDY